MARRCYALILALCISAGSVYARAFEVQLLDGSERDGVWGTEEYRVRVTRLGVMRSLEAHGREILWHAGGLYTFPFPSGVGKAIRTVQGEGVGDRGLTIEEPARESSERRGAKIFRFHHNVAKKAVLDGQTLCQVDQTLVLTPTGEISVAYDCHWLRTCRWNSFGVLMFFTSDAVSGCKFMALRDDRVFTGRLLLDTASVSESRLREPLDQLTLHTQAGPVHVVWDSPLPTTFSWRKQAQLGSGDVLALPQNPAGVGTDKPRGDFDKNGLAHPGGPQQDKVLALLQAHVEVREGKRAQALGDGL